MNFINGSVIKQLRTDKRMTQRELAEKLNISDKTVSKWETGKGIPDIGIVEELAKVLGVSIAELLTGNITDNANVSANMTKMNYYICPVCGNIITAVGEGNYSCHGITLPKAEVEEDDGIHNIVIEETDGELYVSLEHDMVKNHYISFFAYVTTDGMQIRKLYPEQLAETRFTRHGRGIIYAYCNRHGLFAILV